MYDEWKNKLYFGDNLDIMREHIPDESIDLIYLDPPFNSKATYNVLFKEKNGTDSSAQITAFEDTWHWDMSSESAFHELVQKGPKKLSDLMQALRSFLGQNDMMAYLTMMAVRLIEMHHILKSTGSIYLHCDPIASHYLKLVMDAIFGVKNFRNEIIWCYTGREHPKVKLFPKRHQIIFFYVKEIKNEFIFNRLFKEYDKAYVELYFDQKDKDGRVYQRQSNGKGGRYKQYLDESPGIRIPDWWEIKPLHGKDYYTMHKESEYLGYPTQKPETLLERIIKASSNEGDIVFDPFCGCGTTVSVAEKLHRKWIGIDITHLAITLMKHRLEDTFGQDLSQYEIIGDPKDLSSAKALAEQNRYQFEWWALSLVGARPAQDKQKGADKGVDGYIYFFEDESGQAKKIVVQVKSGHVTVSQIRDLIGTVEREKAVIGAFITLDEPTGPMKTEAASAGFYETEILISKRKMSYPRIQILTIEELLNDEYLKYPEWALDVTHKKAKRISKQKLDEQSEMNI